MSETIVLAVALQFTGIKKQLVYVNATVAIVVS